MPVPRMRSLRRASGWWSAPGILVELALACVALAVWLAVAPGVVRDASLTVALICSVSTLLFNANPLARLDGYYVLTDGLQLPNLALRSHAWWARRWRQWLGAADSGPPPLLARGEASWLAVYTPGLGVPPAAAGGLLWLGPIPGPWAGWRRCCWRAGHAALGLALGQRRSCSRPAGAGSFAAPRPGWPAACWSCCSSCRRRTTWSPARSWPPEQAQLRAGAAGFVQRLERGQGARVRAGEVLVVLDDPVLVAARERVAARAFGHARAAVRCLADTSGARWRSPRAWPTTRPSWHGSTSSSASWSCGRTDGEVVWAAAADLPGSYCSRGAMLGTCWRADRRMCASPCSKRTLRVRGGVRSAEVRLAEAPGQPRGAAVARGARCHPRPARGRAWRPARRHHPHGPRGSQDGLRARVPVFLLDAAVPALPAAAIGGAPG